MRFWIGSSIFYLAVLAMGLGFPALGPMNRGGSLVLALTMNTLAFVALLLAVLTLVLMIAKVLFPIYWWMSHIEAKDIYVFDGVFFVGNRLGRMHNRLHKLVFAPEEQMRRWNLIFGLLVLALLAPHLIGGYNASLAYDRIFTRRPLLHETLHAPTLSMLPVMREWKRSWTADAGLAAKVRRELRRARKDKSGGSASWFRIAELQLLNAFQQRRGAGQPFQNTPGDRVWFNRGQGAEAVSYLKRILALPETDRAGWSRGALALIGFFHLSDRDYQQAESYFDRALSDTLDGEEGKVSQYQVVLLAAQTALMTGNPGKAEALLETVLVDERLPAQAYALAMEHFADAMRLAGETERVAELLGKTLDLYEKQKDRGGIARVHLRLAALAMEEGRNGDASHELSLAASLAEGMEDAFTLNMVEGLSQFFPQML